MSIERLCKLFNQTPSGYYRYLNYKPKRYSLQELTAEVITIFNDSGKTYGTRRIKGELLDECKKVVSRRKIKKIMDANGLLPLAVFKNDSPAQSYHVHENCENLLKREFNGKAVLEWLASDLTFVRVNGIWHYICCILDLYNRQIVGYSVGAHKTSQLVKEALLSVEDLSKTKYFHTDCGSEFKGKDVVEFLMNLGIRRSLSAPGCPNDNAVIESFYKTLKTEFVQFKTFNSLGELQNQLTTYIYWYNTKRRHSTLNGLSPVKYALMHQSIPQNTTYLPI
jgi:transposase InsO family protein